GGLARGAAKQEPLSSHALRVEGIEQLYMGAPIRTASACSSSSMSVTRTASVADCSGVRSHRVATGGPSGGGGGGDRGGGGVGGEVAVDHRARRVLFLPGLAEGGRDRTGRGRLAGKHGRVGVQQRGHGFLQDAGARGRNPGAEDS